MVVRRFIPGNRSNGSIRFPAVHCPWLCRLPRAMGRTRRGLISTAPRWPASGALTNPARAAPKETSAPGTGNRRYAMVHCALSRRNGIANSGGTRRAIDRETWRRRHPHATVLMNDLSVHKPTAVERVPSEAGFRLLYRPRYSLDLAPIEPSWSHRRPRPVRLRLGRSAAPRTPAPALGGPRAWRIRRVRMAENCRCRVRRAVGHPRRPPGRAR
jgi:hypothetical protein